MIPSEDRTSVSIASRPQHPGSVQAAILTLVADFGNKVRKRPVFGISVRERLSLSYPPTYSGKCRVPGAREVFKAGDGEKRIAVPGFRSPNVD